MFLSYLEIFIINFDQLHNTIKLTQIFFYMYFVSNYFITENRFNDEIKRVYITLICTINKIFFDFE